MKARPRASRLGDLGREDSHLLTGTVVAGGDARGRHGMEMFWNIGIGYMAF